MDSANAEALESSLLPFRFCERHHLPRSYERSLRLEGGRLWANRFVLGVPAQSLTQAMFGDLLQTLNFPDPRLVPQLGLHWRRASTLYLGFAEAAQGHSRRLYFEYWQEVEHRLHTARSQARATPLSLPRGTGFKWCPQQPGSLHRTDYSHQAGLSRADLLQRCRRALLLGDPQAAPRHDNDNDNSNSNEKHKDNENENQNENENENENDKNLPRPKDTLAPADHHHLFRPLLTLIEGILQSAPAIQPVFLEAREPGSCRSSFDLCLHPYAIRLQQLQSSWMAISRGLLLPGEQERLEQLWPSNHLATHLSGGLSAQGRPYLCLYSQQDD